MSRLRLRLLIGLVVAVALAWGATLDLTAAKAAAKATAKAVATATAATKAPAAATTPVAGATTAAAATKPAKVKTPKVKTPKVRGGSKLDVYLARAQERFGSKLPNWVFGRWGIVAAIALIAICVVFAELVSNLLLIAGVMVLLVGGVTMLDSVIARRLLHHKITPIQVVIGGGSIFVAGLLVGRAA